MLVIGDNCTDVYLYGCCKRLCPSAPVPVFVPSYRKESKGMAGNVYQNVISLGLPTTLKCNNSAIVKTRYVDEETNHMLLRVDSGEEKIDRIKKLDKDFLNRFDAIIISDYDKGFLHKEDIKFICDNHPLVFIDTKKIIGDYCKNCAFIKINQPEFERSFVNRENDAYEWAFQKLIVTSGSKGASYMDKNYPVKRVEIKDLCGAGDTFIAALVSEYLKTKNIGDAIQFANICSTKVVQMKGVNTVDDI